MSRVKHVCKREGGFFLSALLVAAFASLCHRTLATKRAPPLTVLSALSPFTVGVGHGHRRNHSHARLAAHAAAAYLPNGTSVLTAADSKRLFHPPPWMVGFVAKLPPGLRAVEPIELILLVGA